MALQLLGLLGSQGARTIATRLISTGLSAQRSSKIARNLQKTATESLSKGKVPTNSSLISKLSKSDKNLLSQKKYRDGLLNPTVPGQPINLLGRTPTASTYGQRIGTGGERIVLPRRGYTQRYSDAGKLLPVIRGSNLPVPVGQNAAIANQANASISRAAINAQREAAIKSRQAAYGRSPITQTVDKGLGNYAAYGLLTGLGAAPMFMPGGEQPTQAGTMSTGRLLSQAPQQEQAPAMRFGEVLRPSSQSTAREVLNAALLRAGLSLMKPTRPGQTPLTQALESASTVASSQTSYTSGEQALAAGKVALGEDAKISVFQRSDGTFGYQGTTADTSLTDNSFFGEQPEGDNVTKEQYDKAVATIKAQYPNATEQDIKDTLEANNIRYTGE
jgi:hypothetical protein